MWLSVLVVMVLGVQKGIGATSVFFIPVLFLAFTVLVVQSLFLDGAGQGLDALFSPEWSALADTGVWAAAFGQIFFSLSVGFGIMITYASYVGRKTDMTGSGMVVGHFAGLIEGAVFPVGSSSFRISYVGGDGNDVTLSYVVETTTQLSADASVTTYGDQVSFSALVTAAGSTPTGSVSFYDGSVVPGNLLSTTTVDNLGIAVFSTAGLSAGAAVEVELAEGSFCARVEDVRE